MLVHEDGRPVDACVVGRRVLDKVQETYHSELGNKDFVYNGEKSLLTVDPLPIDKFNISDEDFFSNRNNWISNPDHTDPDNGNRCPHQSKKFVVILRLARKISMQAISSALCGQETQNLQEALRMLHIILRQHAARQACHLYHGFFFRDDVATIENIGGGVIVCRGFRLSFRTTQGGLSLNIDASTTMIIQPGPMVDFIIANQNVRDPFSVN